MIRDNSKLFFQNISIYKFNFLYIQIETQLLSHRWRYPFLIYDMKHNSYGAHMGKGAQMETGLRWVQGSNGNGLSWERAQLGTGHI